MNEILHAPEVREMEGTWRGLLVSRQQHRDRPEAEDPGDEHLQDRAGRHAGRLRRPDVGPEPRLQEGLHRRVFDVRRRAVRLPDRRLRVLEPSEGRRPAAQPVRHLRLGAHAVHRRRLAAPVPHGQLAGTAEPAGPAADRLEPGLRLLAVAARERGQPLHRPDHAAGAGPPALRRRDRAGEGLRLRGGGRTAITTSTSG